MPQEQSYRGYVYLIGSRKFGWFKIGKSRNAKIRISDLGILLPFKIEVFAIWGTQNETILEKEFHDAFSMYRINGEWFGFEQDFVFFVAARVSIYPSTLIYKCGDLDDAFCTSNMEKDFVYDDNKEWKRMKCLAYRAACSEWLKEQGMEDSKENFKIAQKDKGQHQRYIKHLRALQFSDKVVTK